MYAEPDPNQEYKEAEQRFDDLTSKIADTTWGLIGTKKPRRNRIARRGGGLGHDSKHEMFKVFKGTKKSKSSNGNSNVKSNFSSRLESRKAKYKSAKGRYNQIAKTKKLVKAQKSETKIFSKKDATKRSKKQIQHHQKRNTKKSKLSKKRNSKLTNKHYAKLRTLKKTIFNKMRKIKISQFHQHQKHQRRKIQPLSLIHI